MRPFEILLLLADFSVLVLMFLQTSPRVYGFHIISMIAVFVAVLQFIVEGPRWQMVPAYLIIGLFFQYWLSRKLIFLLGGLALVTSLILSMAIPVFRFEKPTGSYGIGTLNYNWVDASRLEVFNGDTKTHRQLLVQIWYPARHDVTLKQAFYMPDADAFSAAQSKLHNWPPFLLGHLKYVKTNAQLGAKIAKDRSKFPVLIFLEGITGYRQMNNFQIEELVSQGYIVVAIDQPFVAALVVFPDGRQVVGLSKDQMNPLIQQSITPVEPAPMFYRTEFSVGIIPYFAQDVVFTLDQLSVLNDNDPSGILTDRLDLQRIGTFGVSLGGIIAAEACRIDLRLRACMVMDAPMTTSVVREGLRQPTMWITRDAQTMRDEGWSQFDIDQHQTTMRTAYNRKTSGGYFIQVTGMFHANLTDVPYFSPLLPWGGIAGPLDKRRAHDIINAYSISFFEKYLDGPPSSFLDGPAIQFPEVQYEQSRRK